MPKVLPEYLELRRQQILDAAAACFTRAGFHQTTMQDICAESDLSPGAVYRYFPSKEAIIQAMCLRGHEQDVETIREVVDNSTTGEAFETLVHLFFETSEDREMCALSIELLGESRRDPVVLESVKSGLSSIHAALAELVRRAQARGEMSPDLDPEAMGRVMLGLYQGLVWQKVLEPDLDVLPYAQAVKALFAASIAGASAAPAQVATALQH
ncbi:MAG: TetR/AcrR family transcriptional regulator [Dehalococcoidia bacterium]